MGEKDRRPLLVRLADFYEPHEVLRWLNAPHPQLEDRTALSLVDEGREEEVHAVLDRLDAGGYL